MPSNAVGARNTLGAYGGMGLDGLGANSGFSAQSEKNQPRQVRPRLTGPVAERRDEIVRLTKAGYSAAEIAKQLGVSPRTVVRQRKTGGCAQARPKWLTYEQIRRAETLLDDGASYGEVARTIGCSYQAVSARFPGRGYSKSQGGEMRRLMAGFEAI